MVEADTPRPSGFMSFVDTLWILLRLESEKSLTGSCVGTLGLLLVVVMFGTVMEPLGHLHTQPPSHSDPLLEEADH